MAHMGLGLARQEAHAAAASLSHAAQAITLFDRANDWRLAVQARINLALAHAVQEHWVEAMPLALYQRQGETRMVRSAAHGDPTVALV
jgi:hypothetical protein